MIIIQDGLTFGVEVEVDNITPRDLRSWLVLHPGWTTTRDASVETDISLVENLKLLSNVGKSLPVPVDSKTIGTEILSPILDYSKVNNFNDLNNLFSTLESLGESQTSARSSLHVHVSVSHPTLRILKSIIRLGRFFEPLFFYVGGMGYKFRGEENDSIYCRPITSYGPACIRSSTHFGVQCFNIDDLLSTKSFDDFWNVYNNCFRVANRYLPARYSWLNLVPMCPNSLYKGTLEFRVFNKSLNTKFVLAVIGLCVAFTNLAIKSSFLDLKELQLLKENSIFTATKKDAFDLLHMFKSLIEVDRENFLSRIIASTPEINLQPGYVWTHKNTENPFSNRDEYSPTKIPAKKIRFPTYVDIHVLRGEVNVPTDID